MCTTRHSRLLVFVVIASTVIAAPGCDQNDEETSQPQQHDEQSEQPDDESALEALDDVQQPIVDRDDRAGYGFQFLEQFSGSFDDAYLMADSGVFQGTDLVVGDDEIRDGDEQVIGELVDEADDPGQITVAADATTDAEFVFTLAHQLGDDDIETVLLVGTGVDDPQRHKLRVNDRDASDSPLFRIDIGANGITMHAFGDLQEPIDGCPVDGPTICAEPDVDTEQLLDSAEDNWRQGDFEAGLEDFDRALEGYQLHEVFNFVSDLHHLVPDHRAIQITADAGIPVAVAQSVAATVSHRRDEAQVEEFDELLEADPETEPSGQGDETAVRMFDRPVVAPADAVESDPDDGEGLAALEPETVETDLDDVGGIGRLDDDNGELDESEEHPGDGEVEFETPDTEGALDREIIERVVRQHRREIEHCYNQQLQRDTDLEGRITVEWTISASGDVISASVDETTMNNEEVERCLERRIRQWSFPEGGGIVRVNYPFNFSD